jgi:hypothetical protein
MTQPYSGVPTLATMRARQKGVLPRQHGETPRGDLATSRLDPTPRSWIGQWPQSASDDVTDAGSDAVARRLGREPMRPGKKSFVHSLDQTERTNRKLPIAG